MKKAGKKRWADMTGPQRAGVVVQVIVQVALLAAALSDIRRRPPEAVRGPKRVWRAVAFVNYVGPVAYFLFGRKRPAAGA